MRISKSKPRYALRIDPIRCDGFGYCVELMPELMEFDDWGFPILKDKVISTHEALYLAKRVEHLCPKMAFKVVDTSREI